MFALEDRAGFFIIAETIKKTKKILEKVILKMTFLEILAKNFRKPKKILKIRLTASRAFDIIRGSDLESRRFPRFRLCCTIFGSGRI